MGRFDKLFKKYKENNTIKQSSVQGSSHDFSANTASKEFLDDVTFIQEIKHIAANPWHQYDVLLAAKGYGWEMMIDWADYMS